jgi:DNA-binding MarR family transcriptional regulator
VSAQPAEDADPDQQAVVDALLATSRLLVALTARSLSELDVEVTLPQYRTLVVLASRGAQRTVDLAEELRVQPSTVTRMCDRLIRKKLVCREQRESDRRVAWLRLTESGKELVGDTMRRRRAEIAAYVERIDVPDPSAMAAALTALVVAAGEVPEPQWWRNWEASTS